MRAMSHGKHCQRPLARPVPEVKRDLQVRMHLIEIYNLLERTIEAIDLA